MMKKLVIVGSGGFGAEVAWVADDLAAACPAEGYEVVGFADDDSSVHGSEQYGYRCLGTVEQVAERFASEPLWYHCALGDNAVRQRMAVRCDALGLRAATLIHPSVVRAKHVEIGEGTYIGALAVLHPYVKIGRHVLINVRVGIGHHAQIGDFAQLCPGVQINGACRVGEGALFGSNATIVQRRNVGRLAVVGANSLVVGDVADGRHVVGVPARPFCPEPSK